MTDQNKSEINPERDVKFMAYHFAAVELRYAGKTYKDIAIELEAVHKKVMKESSIRKWFMRGGILEQMYLDFARKENDRRRRHMVEELKKLSDQIPKKFQELLNRPGVDMLTLRTIKELAALLGLKPGEEDGNDDILDEYFDRVEAEIKSEENNADNPKDGTP